MCCYFFFAFSFFFSSPLSPCPSLFWLHLNPGVHIIPFQVILFYLATGPHLHAVGEVAGSGRQDEVVNQGSACSSNDWANPENLECKTKSLHQVFLVFEAPLRILTMKFSAYPPECLLNPMA